MMVELSAQKKGVILAERELEMRQKYTAVALMIVDEIEKMIDSGQSVRIGRGVIGRIEQHLLDSDGSQYRANFVSPSSIAQAVTSPRC
ncbi:hypothetical protein ACFL6R_00035 [Gemmatimonadota bacterium]